MQDSFLQYNSIVKEKKQILGKQLINIPEIPTHLSP